MAPDEDGFDTAALSRTHVYHIYYSPAIGQPPTLPPDPASAPELTLGYVADAVTAPRASLSKGAVGDYCEDYQSWLDDEGDLDDAIIGPSGKAIPRFPYRELAVTTSPNIGGKVAPRVFSCSCNWTVKHGLPCRHMFLFLLRDGDAFETLEPCAARHFRVNKEAFLLALADNNGWDAMPYLFGPNKNTRARCVPISALERVQAGQAAAPPPLGHPHLQVSTPSASLTVAYALNARTAKLLDWLRAMARASPPLTPENFAEVSAVSLWHLI